MAKEEYVELPMIDHSIFDNLVEVLQEELGLSDQLKALEEAGKIADAYERAMRGI